MTTKQLNSSLNNKKNTYFSKKRLIQSSLTILIASSLTACGGGGGGETIIPADNTPTVIYVDGDPLVPVTYDSLGTSAISGTLEQQTVINATAAWDAGYKGQGITIGTIDTGVNPNHIEFYRDDGTSRVNYLDAAGIEYDAINDQLIYSDNYIDTDTDYHHGTHVASIALGREYGIAPEATLLPVNVFQDNVETYNIAVLAAADYLADKTPIMNTSISGMVNLSTQGGTSSELNAYKTILENNDTALIVSAGNGGNDEIGDPIGAEHFINNNTAKNLAIQTGIDNQVLSVIALDDSGSIASFSNYPGNCSDVPGTSDISCDGTVMSAIQNTFISVPGVTIKAADGSTTTGTVSYSGTSMAAPIVSGSLAVLLSSWDQLTIQQAVEILKTTANNSGIYAAPETYGVGLLDLQAALTPVGNLKSTASTQQTQQSYTLSESTLKVPASLSGLASLSALKSVAYFDNYNRDFSVDITPAIQIEKTPIEWNRYWANAQPGLTTQAEVAKFTVSAGFDYNNENNLKNLKISDDQLAIQYARNSSNGFVESQFTPLSQNFYSNNLNDFGNSLAIMQNITPGLFVYSAVQEQQTPTLKGVQNNHTFAKLQSVGVNYHLTPSFAINVSSQLREEQDALMGIQGTGTFSFGDKNLSQMNTFALQYNNNGTQLFGQFQTGQLLNSQLASGSYLDVKNVELGQFKFGVLQQVNNHSSWGVQAYNYNTLLNSDINLTLPTGMNANGDIETQTVKYHQKGNINPDTVELFFNFKTTKQSHLQLNAINNPDDSGIGISMSQRF